MFARFDENPAMTLRVIKETKRYGRTDGQRENSIPPTNKVCGGYNYCFHRSKKIFQEWIITLKILFLCRLMSWTHFEVYLLQGNEKIGSPGRPE